MIDMAKKEQVDWFIPFPGELLVIPKPPKPRHDKEKEIVEEAKERK